MSRCQSVGTALQKYGFQRNSAGVKCHGISTISANFRARGQGLIRSFDEVSLAAHGEEPYYAWSIFVDADNVLQHWTIPNRTVMITALQGIFLICILLVTLAGGYLPFARPDRSQGGEGFPLGEAFSSGVFLALALTMMLPSSFAVFRQTLPDVNYPVGSVIAIVAFLLLLAAEHLSGHVTAKSAAASHSKYLPAVIPITMTVMIAVPSFFLGTALGISTPAGATLIFIAIMLHKGTAAFALALAMNRSTLSQPRAMLLFAVFALSTPIGILLGGEVHTHLAGGGTLVKGVFLALGAGTFLYMGTLHELKHSPMIEHCCRRSCFVAMFAGLAVTALVRFIVGEAHKL